MKNLLRLFLPMVLLLSSSLATEDHPRDRRLHTAKDAKRACELPNGDVKALTDDPEIQALVAEKNAKRLAKYQEIAQQKGVDISVVRKAAAEEIRRRHPNHVCP